MVPYHLGHNKIENHVPLYEIYVYPIFKRIAVTNQTDRVPAKYITSYQFEQCI